MKQNTILAYIDLSDLSDSVVRAKEAIVAGAEGIVVFESYYTKQLHEENIHKSKAICEAVNVPVYARVDGKDKEDVKKFLYAGCKGVMIKADEIKTIEDAALRFGSGPGMIPQETKGESGLVSKISFSNLKTVDGLIPCIVQDEKDGTVLMMAYMNEESFNATLKTGKMTYYSRSRKKLWEKGEESGHTQFVKSLTADCDLDTLLAKVSQVGVACHTGERSCFFNDIIGKNTETTGNDVVSEVYEIVMDRKANPKEGSYTNYLFDAGIDKILKKVGEEASEIIIAAKNPEKQELIYEVCDEIYHLLVLLAERDISWEEITKELKNR